MTTTQEDTNPQAGGEDQRQKYAALAAQYANRVVRLLEGRSAIEDRASKGPLEAREPLEVARIYASVADVYARLAGGTGADQ